MKCCFGHRPPASPRNNTPVHAGRIVVLSNRVPSLSRSSLSSSLYGESAGQLFSSCTGVAASVIKPLARKFVTGIVPASCLQILSPPSRQSASGALFADHGLPSGVGHFWCASFCQPQIAAILTQVDRVRFSFILHQNGCDVTKLEAFSLPPFVPHESGHRLPHLERKSTLSCSRLCPPPYRSVDTVRIPEFPLTASVLLLFSSFANLQHCSWLFGLQTTLSVNVNPKARQGTSLQPWSFGLQMPPRSQRQLQRHPSPSALQRPSFSHPS